MGAPNRGTDKCTCIWYACVINLINNRKINTCAQTHTHIYIYIQACKKKNPNTAAD